MRMKRKIEDEEEEEEKREEYTGTKEDEEYAREIIEDVADAIEWRRDKICIGEIDEWKIYIEHDIYDDWLIIAESEKGKVERKISRRKAEQILLKVHPKYLENFLSERKYRFLEKRWKRLKNSEKE